MKVQFDDRCIRVRLGKAEFAALREGARLDVRAGWPGGAWSFALGAGAMLGISGEGGDFSVVVPRADLEDLAARLPARDGLRYRVERPEGALELTVEVDLHDGRVRTR